MDELTRSSLDYLRGMVFNRYGRKYQRQMFMEDHLWKTPEDMLLEYPITLSTTFSSRTSLRKVTYDYIIMDEVSQMDIVTGTRALSVARNAVIVGDQKQLPNVVSDLIRQQTNAIFESYQVPSGYSFADNSFLKSVSNVIENVPQTLLREYYRCHPKIIGFCNQKFYRNELVVMTVEHGETDTLSVYRTVSGKHHHGHVNQRQIDVTSQEVLPAFSNVPDGEIGIIAPYRDQVGAMKKAVDNADIEVDNVHEFQGREKDAIILTTMDDQVTDFSDNPYLLNVAVSHAKKQLCLVISGAEQPDDSNIRDLVAYIEYNNFNVVDSEIYSVFDLMYQEYTRERIAYLQTYRKIAQYDSEDLMCASIIDLLEDLLQLETKVICHQRLSLLIRDFFRLTEWECRYAVTPGTNVDFPLYNPVSKTGIDIVSDLIAAGKEQKRNREFEHNKDELKQEIRALFKGLNDGLNDNEKFFSDFAPDYGEFRDQIMCDADEILAQEQLLKKFKAWAKKVSETDFNFC